MIRNSRSLPFPRSLRGGATLTEVLMAILIMSIGIVSVCALFPISIVSSIRATQLTNGKILRENVNELVHCVPELLEPPFGEPWNVNLTWKGPWQPNTIFEPNDIIWPSIPPGSLVPNPYFALRCSSPNPGRTGNVEPEWGIGSQYSDGDVVWDPIPIPNYVVDPYGFHFSGVAEQRVFGNRDAISISETISYLDFLPRRSSGPRFNQNAAVQFFAAPDSWSADVQEFPVSIVSPSPDVGSAYPNGSQITFPSNINFDNISTDPRVSRVIFSTPDGKESLVRYPVAGLGNKLEVALQIPSTFLGPARIESYSPRYTYFLTVRNNGVGVDPTITCAVVFNRQTAAFAEHAYRANFGNSEFSGDPDLIESGLDEDQVKIVWTTDEPDPFLKVGSYLLDARALVFYRIVAIRRSGNTALITLNRPVEALTRGQPGLAIMMPGIIHVYYVPLTLHSNQ
jgi:Tfp pilus assembly protein PilV